MRDKCHTHRLVTENLCRNFQHHPAFLYFGPSHGVIYLTNLLTNKQHRSESLQSIKTAEYFTWITTSGLHTTIQKKKKVSGHYVSQNSPSTPENVPTF